MREALEQDPLEVGPGSAERRMAVKAVKSAAISVTLRAPPRGRAGPE